MNNISISSKKVIDFYSKHNNIDPNVMNEIFVDILENIISTMSNQANTSIMTSILNTLKENSHSQQLSLKENENALNNIYKSIDVLKNDITNVKDSLSKVSSDITTNLSLKLLEIKQVYINDIRDLFSKYDTDTYSKLIPILDKNTSNLIDKTTTLFNQIIPNSHDEYFKLVDSALKNFQSTIKLDNLQFLNDVNNKNNNVDTRLNEFIRNLDNKFNDLSINIQKPMSQYINSTEDRLINKLSVVNDFATSINSKQDKLNDDLCDFLNKFRTAPNKGQLGEGLLFNILTALYPTAEITDTTNDASNRCDFLLKRNNKSSILIENKDHSRNVSPEEVNKFIRDVNKHDMNGIFFSQKTGITSKPNWFIEIYNNKVRLYCHNVNYSNDIIRTAIDVVDTLSYHLSSIENPNLNINDNVMSEDTLKIINSEVAEFINQKLNIVRFINDNNKLLLDKINELSISPTLINILKERYSCRSEVNPFECKYCNRSYLSQASLSAHLRGCKKKVDTNTIDLNDTTSLSSTSTLSEIKDEQKNTINSPKRKKNLNK
jgi:hypothetical protein